MNLEIKNLKSGKKFLMYVSHYIARLSRFLDPLCHTKLYHYSFLPNSSASRHHYLCSSKVELTYSQKQVALLKLRFTLLFFRLKNSNFHAWQPKNRHKYMDPEMVVVVILSQFFLRSVSGHEFKYIPSFPPNKQASNLQT